MKKIDYRSLDGHLLGVFLLVLEERSATRAALRLGVTQSSISHALSRLRRLLGDPLFVRSGQNLIPTERALSLREPVKEILDSLQELTQERNFDPTKKDLSFTIAANDLQRDLIFPQLLRDLRQEGVNASFEFVPSGHPTPDLLRDAKCHVALTPFPPDATDIIRKPILSGSMMCFFDGNVRSAPESWDEYCRANHLTVRFPDGGTSQRALSGVDKASIREATVAVPNFSSIPPFLEGTSLIATEVDLMKRATLRDFDMAPLPFKSDRVVIFLTWHLRSNTSPSNLWLRNRIERIAKKTTDFSNRKN